MFPSGAGDLFSSGVGIWSAPQSEIAVGVTVLAGLALLMTLFCSTSRRSQPSNSSSSSSSNSTSSSSTSSSTSSSYSWVQLRSVLLVVASSSPAHCSSSSDRVRLKSPWSRRKRKLALSLNQWRQFFSLDGGLRDGGVKLMKRVRSGGVDPSIRAEVWPFLLGVYDLNSSKEERDIVRDQKRKEYEKLRRRCRQAMKCINGSSRLNGDSCPETDSPSSEEVVSAREFISSEEIIADSQYSVDPFTTLLNGNDTSKRNMNADSKALNSDSSDSDSSVESEVIRSCPSFEANKQTDHDMTTKDDVSPLRTQAQSTPTSENFSTWKRIIRLDAVRTNADWIPYSPTQAEVLNDRARQSAEAVGLKDYDHLEPCRVSHAARLVAILEAYALYDPEIGYCQGMSDLLSPIAAVMTEDHDAFWCFVGFMKKARHNFRLDEVGIRRQLHIVSKIIRCKDSHLYRHLEQLQAEDCFFVYRMVVVLFRRELTFEQTICLWEVMWADQAAVRNGIGKSAWSKIRQRAPPTEDLLLYAIAASVLQKRKLIIEKYSSMDEILRECNGMCGQLDIWKLLDDAHDLVVNLHDKIETSISAPSLS